MPWRKSNAHESQAHTRVLVASCLGLLACGQGEFSPQALSFRSGSAQLLVPAQSEPKRYALSLNISSRSSSHAFTLSLTPSPSTGDNIIKTASQSALAAAVQGLQARLHHEAHSFDMPKDLNLTWPKLQTHLVQAPAAQLKIFSPFSGELNQELSARLIKSSQSLAIYLDQRVPNPLAPNQLEQLLQDFEHISLPRLNSIAGTAPDTDHNGKINILLSGKEQFGDNILGFFRPVDLLPGAFGLGTQSNRGEYLYLRLPDADDSLALFQATLTHEAFHLIHFYQKTLKALSQSGSSPLILESTFLSEGLAHLAEELCGWGEDSAILAHVFLSCIHNASLFGPGRSSSIEACQPVNSAGDGLAQRGGNLLLLLYILQQSGGVFASSQGPHDLYGAGLGVLRQLIQGAATGINNLEQATGRSLSSWLNDFSATLLLDNQEQYFGPRFAFFPEDLDPFTSLPRNLRINTTKVIAGQTYPVASPQPQLHLELRSPYQATHQLSGGGFHFTQVDVPANTELKLSITTSPATPLSGMLIPLAQN